ANSSGRWLAGGAATWPSLAASGNLRPAAVGDWLLSLLLPGVRQPPHAGLDALSGANPYRRRLGQQSGLESGPRGFPAQPLWSSTPFRSSWVGQVAQNRYGRTDDSD